MSFRLSPAWWPFLALTSPLTVPLLLIRNQKYQKERAGASELNQNRINQAGPLELPELDFLELTVIVEWEARGGFIGDAGC